MLHFLTMHLISVPLGQKYFNVSKLLFIGNFHVTFISRGLEFANEFRVVFMAYVYSLLARTLN